MQSPRLIRYLPLLLLLLSCSTYANSVDNTINGNAGSRLCSESFGEFNEPWAMTFLPSGDLLVSRASQPAWYCFRQTGTTVDTRNGAQTR
ncbi:hypothetical protein [Desulfobacula sp.]|uniref:hypothetical protein n=1 Tax=Desulfobacula sp. TaxID=2593537 RepID=UPI00261B42DA|nr:hypothetical protein [Desulfobacula sp.]